MLAPLVRHVARRRMCVGHEQVLYRIAIAARAAQAEHLPVIDDLRLRAQEQEGTIVRPAIADVRRAVGILHGAVGAEPLGVAPAAGEAPGAAQPIAAVNPDGTAVVVPCTPGEARIGTLEHLRCRFMRHGGRRGCHRDVGLVDEPSRAGVGPRQRLVGFAIGQKVDLLPAQASRQHHAQQVLPRQRIDDLLSELAPPVHLRAVLIQHGLHGARSFGGAGGKSRWEMTLHRRFPRASVG